MRSDEPPLPPLRIHTAADLTALIGRPRPRRQVQPVRLEIDGIPEAERGRWERALERYHSACGCDTGTLFMLAALAYVGIEAVGALRAGIGPSFGAVGRGALVVVGAAMAGKFAGLIYARIRLRAAVRSVRALIPDAAAARRGAPASIPHRGRARRRPSTR